MATIESEVQQVDFLHDNGGKEKVIFWHRFLLKEVVS